jgi:hypothetical protein
MNSKIIAAIVAVVIIAFVIFALTTQEPIKNEATTQTTQNFDPFAVPMLKHMEEDEKISFGTEDGNDVRVSVLDSGKISIFLSDHLIEKLGEDTLAKLELPDQTVVLSQDSYVEFLKRLHDVVIIVIPHSHDNDHDHEHHDHDK